MEGKSIAIFVDRVVENSVTSSRYGKPSKQIFGKSWECSVVTLTPHAEVLLPEMRLEQVISKSSLPQFAHHGNVFKIISFVSL